MDHLLNLLCTLTFCNIYLEWFLLSSVSEHCLYWDERCSVLTAAQLKLLSLFQHSPHSRTLTTITWQHCPLIGQHKLTLSSDWWVAGVSCPLPGLWPLVSEAELSPEPELSPTRPLSTIHHCLASATTVHTRLSDTTWTMSQLCRDWYNIHANLYLVELLLAQNFQ